MKAFSNDVKICAIFQDKDLIRKEQNSFVNTLDLYWINFCFYLSSFFVAFFDFLRYEYSFV